MGKPRYIAHGDKPRDGSLQVLFILFRFMLYTRRWASRFEVAYSIARAGRDVPLLRLFFQFQWSVDPRLGLDGP